MTNHPNRSKKTLTITLSGGFHNSGEKTIRAEIVGDCAYISERQARELHNHFCGISDCACGGAYRAHKQLPGGWTVGGFSNGGDVCALRSDGPTIRAAD